MARPTTDLAEWLGRHGLGQYVQTFAENNIEYSVLPDLTEDDLEKLGVSLGHRKKLLRAIEALTAAGQRTGTTTAVSNVTEVSPTSGQHREAEFRQITVMSTGGRRSKKVTGKSYCFRVFQELENHGFSTN
jgi:hypothetical protein